MLLVCSAADKVLNSTERCNITYKANSNQQRSVYVFISFASLKLNAMSESPDAISHDH